MVPLDLDGNNGRQYEICQLENIKKEIQTRIIWNDFGDNEKSTGNLNSLLKNGVGDWDLSGIMDNEDIGKETDSGKSQLQHAGLR